MAAFGPWQPWFLRRAETKYQVGADLTSLDWGLLANTGFDRQEMKSVYFFAGNWRCCQGFTSRQFYEYPVVPNESFYTVHPTNPRDLAWSEQPDNPALTLEAMIETGANVVLMSSWGERGSDRWAYWAPMLTSPLAHDQLFTGAIDKNILIMPVIESSNATIGCGGHSAAYHFAADFPGSEDNPAPQLVLQIEDLVQRYVQAPANPAWPGRWAQMYDRAGQKRYAINILHVASTTLAADEHERFARGFDLVADRVFRDTGVLVGFTLDLLPEKHTVDIGNCGAPWPVRDTFIASAEQTGPYLRQQASFLGVQAFIPEIWASQPDEDALIAYKYDYWQRWLAQGVPVILDVSAGYDAHLVFPGSKQYGNNERWRAALSAFRNQPIRGISFNTWNGYTEGYAAVPTVEYGDAALEWVRQLFESPAGPLDAPPGSPLNK